MPDTHSTFTSFFKTVNRKEENSTIAWTAHLTAKFKVLRELLHRHHRGENRKGHSILANQGKLKTVMAMAIPVGPFWEHPWEPQEAVTRALYECISVQVKPWPQSWGKLKAGMVRKVQLQPNLTSKIIRIQWWFCSIKTQFYIAAYESGHMTYGSFHLRAIGRATFSQNWKYKILKQLHRNINQFGERILIRTKVAACSKKMNPIGRRILCVQQVYLQYWVIYIPPTSGYQN